MREHNPQKQINKKISEQCSEKIQEIRSISNLLEQTKDIFISNWKKLLSIELVVIVTAVFVFFIDVWFEISGIKQANPVMWLIMVASYWAQIVVTYTIINITAKKTTQELFEESKPFIGGFILLTILVWLMLLGGFMLFIIPGIILSGQLSMVIWIYFESDRKKNKLEILQQSRDLVKEHWWKVVVAFAGLGIVVWLIAFVLGIPIAVFNFMKIPLLDPIEGLWTAVVNAIIAPITIIYSYLIYTDLKKIKGSLPSPKSTRGIKGWLSAGIVAAILIPFLAVIIFSAIQKNKNQSQEKIETIIQMYEAGKGESQLDSIDDLIKEIEDVQKGVQEIEQ